MCDNSINGKKKKKKMKSFVEVIFSTLHYIFKAEK